MTLRSASVRPTTLRDGMILIAGLAVSIWLFRLLLDLNISVTGPGRMLGGDWTRYFSASYPVLLVASLTTLVIRLLEPRPKGLRLRRQPGLIASLAVVFMALIHVVWFDPLSAPNFNQVRLRELLLYISGPYNVAPGVAIAWLVQAILGAWRAERHWVDRLGRAAGWTWLGYYGALLVLRHFDLW